MYPIIVVCIIIVIVVLLLAVLTTSKAYTYKHTVDPLEDNRFSDDENHEDQKHKKE